MTLVAGKRSIPSLVWMVAIFIAACALSRLGLQAQSTPPWPPQSDQFRFHMIGNAHMDAVWLWPWTEADSVVHSTFRSALDRMNEDPDIAMTTSSSQFYEWIAESDPAMLAEIRKRVDEGRWDLVGGWWVEPDVNIPNGESLARQGLYGQQTLKRAFRQDGEGWLQSRLVWASRQPAADSEA